MVVAGVREPEPKPENQTKHKANGEALNQVAIQRQLIVFGAGQRRQQQQPKLQVEVAATVACCCRCCCYWSIRHTNVPGRTEPIKVRAGQLNGTGRPAAVHALKKR